MTYGTIIFITEFTIIQELITIKSRILYIILEYQGLDLNGLECKTISMSMLLTSPMY